MKLMRALSSIPSLQLPTPKAMPYLTLFATNHGKRGEPGALFVSRLFAAALPCTTRRMKPKIKIEVRVLRAIRVS